MALYFQRTGLLLGLLAWCMQLVVFVQPFLPGGTMSGFGVCQTVVGALSSGLVASSEMHAEMPVGYGQHHHSQHRNPHLHAPEVNAQPLLTHMTSRIMQDSHNVRPMAVRLSMTTDAKKQQAMQPVSLPKSVDHHSSHLSCGFCTLYGHSIPPPLVLPILFSQIQRLFVTLDLWVLTVLYIDRIAYLKPQSRAPPLII